ncbi:MAG: hypothetical protein ACFFCW_28585 [Candidatus Hodarchaeota archaeon]
MPRGLVVARFDELEGPIVLGKNPPDSQMDEEDVMRIFTSHAVGARGEGFLSLHLGGLNTASYYVEKHETPFVMILILRATEKAEEFREVMSDYAERVFDEIEEGTMALDDLLEVAYREILAITEYTDEQRVALVFVEPIGLRIFEKLTDGPVSREELLEYLRTEYGASVSSLNLEYYITALQKAQMIEERRIAGRIEPILFLVKDAVLVRSPPRQVIQTTNSLPDPVKMEYLNASKTFFENYQQSAEDNALLGFALLDHQIYRVINVLRERWFLKEHLVDLLQMPADQLDDIIGKLIELEMAKEIVHNNESYILMVSDFRVKSFTPEYLINKIVSKWNTGRIEKDLAIEHLKILQMQFL